MRRAKIGDVYCFKVPNGLKIVQWAYHIPKRGHYIRVFKGLYDSIPTDIEAIVKAPHCYIIAFDIARAYRIGLAQWLGTYAIPKEYPFPKFRISFWKDYKDEVFSIWLTPNDISATGNMNIISFTGKSMKDLPDEYQNESLLSDRVSPDWLLYLFDNNFDLNELRRFWPQAVLGETWEQKFKEYGETVDRAVAENTIGRTGKTDTKQNQLN